jgi:hypothetical protein
MNKKTSTITLTFGDQAENNVGMQKIGELAEVGFSYKDLKKARKFFEDKGYKCIIKRLHKKLPATEKDFEKAYLLIIRKGVRALIDEGENGLWKEQVKLDVDKKVWMRGRVVNKIARWNLCFDEKAQKPDYDKKKGRLIAYDDVPLTKKIRMRLNEVLGDKGKELMCEGNYYYDTSKCGIGYHGDSERRKVVGIRLGAPMVLRYYWYKKSKRIGEKMNVVLNDGDMYIMSEKAVGTDWKRSSICTLRHGAGCDKYVK